MSRMYLRPMVATGILVVFILCFEIWSWQLGRERLAALKLSPADLTVDIEITLTFTPEAFTIQRLQAAGYVIKITDHHIWLKSVSRDQLAALARLYWIGQIRLWHT
jgi:hypothetical protein